MVKKFLAASVAAIGLMLAVPASASTLKTIADSTYMLYGGNSPHCSIVAVSPTQFVTAHHCVEDEDDLNVRTIKKNDKFEKISEEVRYLKVLRTLKTKDIAFLELRDTKTTMPNLSYVDIAESDFQPQFGDPLIVVGYPMVVDLTVTHGEFTGLVELPMDGMEGGFFKTTVPVTGGNSGGGLYAPTSMTINGEQHYNLIGLTSAGYRNVSFMSYFSTPAFIDDVTKGLLNTNPVSTKTDESVDENLFDGKLINPADLR